MTLNIRTALQNCEAREAKSPLFSAEKAKSMVMPAVLMAAGASIPFAPGMDGIFTALAATASRIAGNTQLIAEHHTHLVYALGAITGGLGAALTAVGILENRDHKKGVEQNERLAASRMAKETWDTISRTNDTLADKVSARHNWLKSTLAVSTPSTDRTLMKHGLDPNNRVVVADLTRAYHHGLKNAVTCAAASGKLPVLDSNLHDQFTQRSIASGMLDYYKGRQAPLKLLDSLKSMATPDNKGEVLDVYQLARSSFEAIRELSVQAPAPKAPEQIGFGRTL
ncbi:hypothetical protein [Pseudomonas sp. PLMAX]|uniref:hypothetical protein n=1 Tax=Pseudomonas sp. PLMAX TaxID=2201998 RepID=UPI0038B7F0BD